MKAGCFGRVFEYEREEICSAECKVEVVVAFGVLLVR